MLIVSQEPDMDALRAVWLSQTKCAHPNAEPRMRTFRNGSNQVNKQCPQCGLSVGQAIPKKNFTPAEIAKMPEFDDEAEKRFAAEKDALWYDIVAKEKSRLSENWQISYRDYLKSPEWKSRRDRVMARAGGVCEGCLDHDAILVHHRHYHHVGDELLFDLVALCDVCHAKCHPEKTPLPTQDD